MPTEEGGDGRRDGRRVEFECRTKETEIKSCLNLMGKRMIGWSIKKYVARGLEYIFGKF